MDFKKWVDSRGGLNATGRILGVYPSTVLRWLQLGRIPRPEMLKKIERLSSGQVKPSDVVTTLMKVKR